MPSNISHPISIPNPTTTTSTTTLKTNKDWPKWNNETLKILKIRNLTHLLKDTNKPPPTSPSHRKWTNSQKTTCALIISKLSPAIAKAMRSHKTLETLLQALDTYTKPTPTEALEMLISLWGRLSSLSSSDHASVTDYVAEARDIKAQYIRLGTGVSDAVLSCAFMAGLPVQWREWKMRRMRDQTVLVPWGDCSSSTFLFENLLRDAVEEEARLYEVARREEEVRWGVEVRDASFAGETVSVSEFEGESWFEEKAGGFEGTLYCW
ncbi:hypothetical protein N7533_013705 [Penicillium manginii]|uniref:uncharacterized protein n=1 Tax=Penicillium manginii TaxID=203109 RepID=UPI002546EB03|nr:uncharacterized protein N7533_013705 [Penicillium manginii]KAJ5733258.1 hypothetical protein N7533_013705 [Penicillium manginii]